jgi:hypothetical protein
VVTDTQALGKGLKESMDPGGCKMKGVHGWVHAHRVRQRVEGVYGPKRLQDDVLGGYHTEFRKELKESIDPRGC